MDRSGNHEPRSDTSSVGGRANLDLIKPAAFQGLQPPERRWLVPNWAPAGSVTAIYGDGGLGKSLLVQQLQTATAIGQDWLGLPVARTRSIGLYCEGLGEELWRRQSSINGLYGCDFEDLEDLRWLARPGEDNLLMTFGSRRQGETRPLFKSLTKAARDFGAQLVVIDPIASTFGGDENDRAHVQQFVAQLAGLARAIGGTVVCTAHPSRSAISSGNGHSGSTAWSNGLRSRLTLSARKGSDKRVLERTKSNYSSTGERLTLLRTEDGFVPANAAHAKGPLPNPEEVFLELLTECWDQGETLSASNKAGNYAPKRFATHPRRRGVIQNDFAAAMTRLLEAGAILEEEYGRSGDRRRRLAPSLTR